MGCRNFFRQVRILNLVLWVVCLASAEFVLERSAFAADQTQWLRISSDHFIVLTDAGEKKGHEVVARFEQMRGMFGTLLGQHKLKMSEPLEIIAFRSDKDFAQIAPIRGGEPIEIAHGNPERSGVAGVARLVWDEEPSGEWAGGNASHVVLCTVVDAGALPD